MITFLTGLRLSLIQWTLLTLGSALGVLVLAFRAQGSRLHEAQISLLLATTRNADDTKTLAVVKAKERLALAMKDYYNNKQ